MKSIGRLYLTLYRFLGRAKSKCFSLLISGAFSQFGERTVLTPPIRLSGESRISIDDDVFLGAGCWLQTLPDGDNGSVAISIGRGTSIVGSCVISAVRQVCLEEQVLVARNVYISDHSHKYTRQELAILAQGIDKLAPVVIKRGAWLGQNVVVCPGVTIGRGAVIGANAVVTQNIPDFSVAAGAPARVLKRITPEALPA